MKNQDCGWISPSPKGPQGLQCIEGMILLDGGLRVGQEVSREHAFASRGKPESFQTSAGLQEY